MKEDIKYGQLTPRIISYLDEAIKDYNNGTRPKITLHSGNYKFRDKFIEDRRFAVNCGFRNYTWALFLDVNEYIDDHLTKKPRLNDDIFNILYNANVLFFNDRGHFFCLF